MAMKLVLLAVIVAALSQGTEQKCTSRRDKMNQSKLRIKTMCRKPKEIPVQLPVPDGFDYVEPRVVMLPQCTGLSCLFGKTCVPNAANITKRTYRVNAYTVDDSSQCVEVTVEEHHACRCGCEVVDCPTNQVQSESSCECQCDPLNTHEDACNYRRIMNEHSVMWSQDTCSCACDRNTQEACDSSMEWNPGMCKCVLRSDNYIE